MKKRPVLILLLLLFVYLLFSYGISTCNANDTENYWEISPEFKNPKINSPRPASSPTGEKSGKEAQFTQNPVIINKIINPERGELSGDPLCVSVEIKNNKLYGLNSELNDIYITEIIDDDFRVVDSDIVYYKADNLTTLCQCKIELYRNEKSDKFNVIEDKNGIKFTSTSKEYRVFDWENVSNSESDSIGNNELKNFLDVYFGIRWTNISINRISESNYNKSVIYINDTSGKNGDSIELFIDNLNDKSKCILKINGKRIYEFRVKLENGHRIIYDWMTILHINISKLSKKDSVMYWYYIKPKKSGIFNTETIVRVYDDDYRRWPDMYAPSEIEIKGQNPDFEVNPRYDESQIYKGELLDVVYDITYLGGSGSRCDDIMIEFDNSDYYNYVSDNNIRNDHYKLENRCSFLIDKTVTIPVRIEYTKIGSHPLPGIWINGNHKSFDDRRVIVESIFKKYWYYLPIIISSVTILIAIVELIFFHNELKSTKEQFKELTKYVKGIEKKLK